MSHAVDTAVASGVGGHIGWPGPSGSVAILCAATALFWPVKWTQRILQGMASSYAKPSLAQFSQQ